MVTYLQDFLATSYCIKLHSWCSYMYYTRRERSLQTLYISAHIMVLRVPSLICRAGKRQMMCITRRGAPGPALVGSRVSPSVSGYIARQGSVHAHLSQSCALVCIHGCTGLYQRTCGTCTCIYMSAYDCVCRWLCAELGSTFFCHQSNLCKWEFGQWHQNDGEPSRWYADGWHQNDGEPSLCFTCVRPNLPHTVHQTKAYHPWPPQHIQYQWFTKWPRLHITCMSLCVFVHIYL